MFYFRVVWGSEILFGRRFRAENVRLHTRICSALFLSNARIRFCIKLDLNFLRAFEKAVQSQFFLFMIRKYSLVVFSYIMQLDNRKFMIIQDVLTETPPDRRSSGVF